MNWTNYCKKPLQNVINGSKQQYLIVLRAGICNSRTSQTDMNIQDFPLIWHTVWYFFIMYLISVTFGVMTLQSHETWGPHECIVSFALIWRHMATSRVASFKESGLSVWLNGRIQPLKWMLKNNLKQNTPQSFRIDITHNITSCPENHLMVHLFTAGWQTGLIRGIRLLSIQCTWKTLRGCSELTQPTESEPCHVCYLSDSLVIV